MIFWLIDCQFRGCKSTMSEYTVDQFLELEIQIWDALQSGDSEKDARMLSDDFLGVYDSGISDKNGHTGQLDNGPTVSGYVLSEARIMVLSEGLVLLSYLAQMTRVESACVGKTEKMYVSSIWRCINGKWINIFSQDTPTTQ